MAIVIIENYKINRKRPNTNDCKLFVAPDGLLYAGHYLKDSMLSARIFRELNKFKNNL